MINSKKWVEKEVIGRFRAWFLYLGGRCAYFFVFWGGKPPTSQRVTILFDWRHPLFLPLTPRYRFRGKQKVPEMLQVPLLELLGGRKCFRKEKRWKEKNVGPIMAHTVDGGNPAPFGMYKALWIMGYLPYQLVQDFFHQQYHPCMVYIPIHLVDVYGLHVGFHIPVPWILWVVWCWSFLGFVLSPFFSPLWLVGRCVWFIIIKQLASTSTGAYIQD